MKFVLFVKKKCLFNKEKNVEGNIFFFDVGG